MQALARRIERLEQELSALSARTRSRVRATAGCARAMREPEQSARSSARARGAGRSERRLASSGRRARAVERVRASSASAPRGASWPTPRWRACVRLWSRTRAVQDARREAARVGAELAAANQFLRGHAGVGNGAGTAPRGRSARTCAFATATSSRSRRPSVAGSTRRWSRTSPARSRCWTEAGPDTGRCWPARRGGLRPACGEPLALRAAGSLSDLVSGPAEVLELAGRLLADAWVVARLEDLPRDFAGIGVTRSGRVWFAGWGEVRQLSEGGTERVLARRNERDRLIALVERAAQGEQAAKTGCVRRRSRSCARSKRRCATPTRRCAKASAARPRPPRRCAAASG